MLYPILIKPACKDNIWGGTKLKNATRALLIL